MDEESSDNNLEEEDFDLASTLPVQELLVTNSWTNAIDKFNSMQVKEQRQLRQKSGSSN